MPGGQPGCGGRRGRRAGSRRRGAECRGASSVAASSVSRSLWSSPGSQIVQVSKAGAVRTELPEALDHHVVVFVGSAHDRWQRIVSCR